jgi:ABC-2 type transport system permease protein
VTERPLRSDFPLLGRWTVARLKSIRRTPRAAFFTFIFPLLLLVLLNATRNSSHVTVPGGEIEFDQYFTPSMAIYALTVACYALPIFGLATARDAGILKRVRGTPLSPWIYLVAWATGAILTGLAAVVAIFVVGVSAFGVKLYPELLPAAIVTILVGAVSLAAIGLAVSTFVRRAETAPAIANLTLFPLAFLSGLFFPIETAPQWVKDIAHFFPLSHLVEAFEGCFSPFTTGSGFAFGDLAVVAAWGLAGLLVAVRRFRLEDDAEEGSGRLRALVRRDALEGS